MLHIRVEGAQNLPVPTKKVRKTKVYCFSFSSRRYFYDAFKSKEKTTDPKFDGEFDLDLFRATDLSFTIFSSRLLSKDIFLGRVDIDLNKFLSEPIGKKIISGPHSIVQTSLPITCCDASNATLQVSFSYAPTIYNSIEFKDISKPTVNFWVTFNPPIQITATPEIPVEIEILCANPSKDRKSGDLNVFFTNLNKYCNWSIVGDSSNYHIVPYTTGPTQVHTFALSRVAGCYVFFILNSNNYTGTVSLNFIGEKKDKTKNFNDGHYYEVDTDKKDIGTVETVSVPVEANKKFTAPIFMYYEKKAFSKKLEFHGFPVIPFDKQKMANESDKNVEYSDIMSTQIPFHFDIMNQARKTVGELNDANFMRVYALTKSSPISLFKTINDFNLEPNSRIHIYIGGCRTEDQNNNNNHNRNSNQPPQVDYWEPKFVVYDANNGQRCPAISSSLEKSPVTEKSYPAGKKFMGYPAHTLVNIDLDQVGKDKIVVFGIYCKSEMDVTDSPGFFLISHFDGNQEMLMFREPFFVDQNDIHFALCLRFECVNNDWKIVPMKRYFENMKQSDEMIDTIHANNWVMPDILVGQSNGVIKSDDSD